MSHKDYAILVVNFVICRNAAIFGGTAYIVDEYLDNISPVKIVNDTINIVKVSCQFVGGFFLSGISNCYLGTFDQVKFVFVTK